ncbi:MAG TPA: hypothetical protein DCL44_01465 [Elusimicrobia bacterium]|nr:hypothetical protein [Elusimicrobiota bacterium]
MFHEDTKAKAIVYLGIFLAFLGYSGNFLEIEPMHNMFFIFAWWSYIFIIDVVIYNIKGESLIVSRTDEFFALLPWSVFIWLLFEMLNLRLGNWHYTGLPWTLKLRWTGYLLSFATVLPGLFETTELLETLGLFRNARTRPLSTGPRSAKRFYYIGAAMLALPLLFPKYFFALIWTAFIFLCEPLNQKLGLNSLLSELRKGRPARLYNLLASGGICGFLWELWNYKAGAKWVYSVPFGGPWKLFEMPLPGYIGFPVFAVECYAMYNLITWLRRGKTWEQDCQTPLETIKPPTWLLLSSPFILTVFFYFALRTIDAHTVQLLIGWL